MLRKRTLNQLEKLGLGHIAVREVTFHRQDDIVHGALNCSEIRCEDGIPDVETFTSSIRDLAEECCYCTRRNPYLPELEEALRLAGSAYQEPRNQLPTGISLRTLTRATQEMNTISQAIRSLHWLRPRLKQPEVVAAGERVAAQLQEEYNHFQQLVRTHGKELVREYAEMLWLSKPWNFPRFEELCDMFDAALIRDLLSTLRWAAWAGEDREERRRALTRMYGHILLEQWRGCTGADEEIERAHRQHRKLLRFLDALEDELTRHLEREPVMLLATLERRPHVMSAGITRVATEAATVRNGNGADLLVIPKVVHEALNLDILDWTDHPEDPVHAETAIGLWEADRDSVLSDPQTAVETAGRL